MGVEGEGGGVDKGGGGWLTSAPACSFDSLN